MPAPSYYHPLLLQRHVASKADGQLVIVSGQLLQPDLAGDFVLLTLYFWAIIWKNLKSGQDLISVNSTTDNTWLCQT